MEEINKNKESESVTIAGSMSSDCINNKLITNQNYTWISLFSDDGKNFLFTLV